jgi:hypothetical protein
MNDATREDSTFLFPPSKHGIAIFVIACDFIAEHLGKPASRALKYFEPIVQYLKVKECFCFCSHRERFNYEIDVIAFRARQFYWGIFAILVSNFGTDTGGSTTSKVLTMAAVIGFAAIARMLAVHAIIISIIYYYY